MAEKLTIEDLKAPLIAAVGVVDLALEAANDLVATLRERAEEARTDANARVEEGKARLSKLQDDLGKFQKDLPTQLGDLRDKLTADELRKIADRYADSASEAYDKILARGEAALDKLRQPAKKDAPVVVVEEPTV